MQISQNFSQRMEEKLVMTRQMIQSIEMLQLPLMDLEQNIREELENPWLEVCEGEVVQEASDTDMKDGDEAAKKKAEQAANETDARVRRLESLMNEWNDPN